MFFGRQTELKTLSQLKLKKTASLVCIMGRRRIGKSTLVEEFGKQFKSFIEIQGLGPSEEASNQDQLDHFANELSVHFNSRKEHFETWTDAFSSLVNLTQTGEHLILLDEISWMGKKDPLFPARLKEVWDTQLKKNSQLILVLCGSVSSWIEANILKNTSFEGRISLEINLQELAIDEIHAFWKNHGLQMNSLEKMILLSVTGGVPKYLEEISPHDTASQNIIRLCFNSTGFLFNEYDKIFTEIFERKGKTFQKIVKACLDQKLSPSQLAKKLNMSLDGEFSEHIHILQLSGFLSRDFYYSSDGKQLRLSHLRVKDNYLRFYLKHILPLKDKITSKAKVLNSLSEIRHFETTMGFQFENLVLANRQSLHALLGLSQSDINASAPHIQKKKEKTKGACQIDLLIHTFMDVFFLCEFKCQKSIDKAIIPEVQKKMDVLALPRRSALKPVLVYEGELYPKHETQIREFFYRIISFEQLLNN